MENNILDFIEQHVSLVGNLERDTNLAHWELATTGAKKHENRFAEKSKELKTVYADRQNYIRVRTYDEEKMCTDAAVARQIRLLRLRFTTQQMPADVIERLAETEGQAARVHETFRAVIDNQKLSSSEVLALLENCKNVKDRRAVWEATKLVGNELGPIVLRLVGIRNRAARDLGYRDYYDMALKIQEIDEKFLLTTVDELLKKTEKPYLAAKATIDSELAKKFKCRLGDLRPWHYADPFFRDVPPRREIDIDKYYKRKDLEKLTRELFAGIDLDIADLLKKSDLSPREGKQPSAFCLHVDRRTQDIRVLSNNVRNETWMSTMLHEFGHAAYDKFLSPDLPFVLRQTSNPLLAKAVGSYFSRMSRSPEFLRDVVSADRAAVTRTMKDVNAHTRLEMLLLARWIGVVTYFERALYVDPGCDLNRLWWDLVERYQFLKRPDGRRGYDWATTTTFATAPVTSQNQILAELIASQLRAAIKREVGKASVVGNPIVGRFLKEQLFAPGSKWHFNDLLERVTGERLTSRHFLEDYALSSTNAG